MDKPWQYPRVVTVLIDRHYIKGEDRWIAALMENGIIKDICRGKDLAEAMEMLGEKTQTLWNIERGDN